MDIYPDNIQQLSESEKLLLVQQIWDDLAASNNIPLPNWLVTEAQRRRDEMIADPALGHSHEEVLDRLRKWRNG